MMQRPKIPGDVLTFLPRRLDRLYGELSERVFAGTKTYLCNRRGVRGLHIERELVKRYAGPSLKSPLTDEDYLDIILRDRVLRLLPRDQAQRMIDAMWHVLDEIVDRSRPDYLLSLMVDHYMLDLLFRICRQRRVRVCMCCAGVMKNTTIVTSYGEFNYVRTPSETEVDAAVSQLGIDQARVVYATSPEPYTPRRHYLTGLRWWAYYVGFRALGVLTRETLGYRYLCATMPSVYPESDWTGFRCTRYFQADWEQRLAKTARPALFLPLGFTPEATTDYWLRDLRFVQYESFILDAVRQLSGRFLVVVKEHWASLGTRLWRFYQQLSEIPGVVIVPGEVYSRVVMGHVDNVLVGAGTAGIEAALRGKKVATLDQPYYYLDGHYLSLKSADRIAELPDLLERFQPPVAGDETRRAIVRRMLEPTLMGSQLPISSTDTEENFHAASESLKEYLDANPLAINYNRPLIHAA
jgi:hypothetical protein